MSRAKRVVVAGHTGIQKAVAIERLKKYLETTDKDLANRVGVYDVEDAIKETGGGDPRLLAGVRSGRAQRQRWRIAWAQIQSRVENSGDRCSIINIHLVFAHGGRRVCPADLTAVGRWRPDLIVTLIDDVYAVKRRIQLKGFNFSFSQLLNWRAAESMLADQIGLMNFKSSDSSQSSEDDAPRAYCDSVMLAVKHPVSTLGRLIRDRTRPRAYLSFPISSTRNDAAKRDEIDAFRKRVHEIFIAFDPLTIEELPLVLDGKNRARDRVCFDPNTLPSRDSRCRLRWDCRIADDGEENGPLQWEPESECDASGKEVSFYPIQFDREEIDELWGGESGCATGVVQDHVTIRDFRLVDQADLVICYRPYWDERISGGVGAEIKHANEAGKPVYAFVGADTKAVKPLEGEFTRQFTSKDEFYIFLELESKVPQPIPRPLYY